MAEKEKYLVSKAYYEAGVAFERFNGSFSDYLDDNPVCLYRPQKMSLQEYYGFIANASADYSEKIDFELDHLGMKILYNDRSDGKNYSGVHPTYRNDAIKLFCLPFLVGQLAMLKHKNISGYSTIIFDELTSFDCNLVNLLNRNNDPKYVMPLYFETINELILETAIYVDNNWEYIERVKNGLLYKGVLYKKDLVKLVKSLTIQKWDKEYSYEIAMKNLRESVVKSDVVAIQYLEHTNKYHRF